MTVPQSHRDHFHARWQALIAEAFACAEDAHRDLTELRSLARQARKGWLAPNGDAADGWAMGALQSVADAYAHQPTVRGRTSLQVALAHMAQRARVILSGEAPSAGATVAEAPARRLRADIDDID